MFIYSFPEPNALTSPASAISSTKWRELSTSYTYPCNQSAQPAAAPAGWALWLQGNVYDVDKSLHFEDEMALVGEVNACGSEKE